MLRPDTAGASAVPVTPSEVMAPRCVGKVRGAAAIDQDVSRLLDLACAEQAKVTSTARNASDYAHDPTRLWLPDEPSTAVNPRAAILTAPVWDEAADRLIPQGCCLVQDKGEHQVKLTWRKGSNRHSALFSITAYKHLLDIGSITE
ncbi:hypothetical protein [Pigmentiphaga litoralis]|uniref:hypothetical protein n=1 Tax=Pigmentiphaga litoralis TaxID=516702 RepID=UPI003B43A7AA